MARFVRPTGYKPDLNKRMVIFPIRFYDIVSSISLFEALISYLLEMIFFTAMNVNKMQSFSNQQQHHSLSVPYSLFRPATIGDQKLHFTDPLLPMDSPYKGTIIPKINLSIASSVRNKIHDFWTMGINFFSHNKNHFTEVDLWSKLCIDMKANMGILLQDLTLLLKSTSVKWFLLCEKKLIPVVQKSCILFPTEIAIDRLISRRRLSEFWCLSHAY